MNKRFPWLHLLTPKQRSDMLDADYNKQLEQAQQEDDKAAAERDEEGDDYEALNRF
jgi:hypothetical protein